MIKKEKRKKEKGSSLIELLATIVIITLISGIVGYTVIHTISKSKEKANQIAYANIKTSARYYVEENPTSIFWKKDDSDSEQVYTCVSIDTLVNNGYIEQNKIEDYDDSNYILITKGANQSIISEKIDNVGVCTGFSGGVAIPTKKYCNDLTYDGTEQSLTDTLDAESKFSFSNDKGTNAGRYEVEATLKDSNDVWEDGSTDSKTITCTIKKAWPIISIEPDGNPGTSLTPISATFESKIAGSISLRSSNEEHATATVDNPKMENPGTRTITITPLASRTTTTTITITFNPEDSNNYYSGMTSFTLGNVGITEVEKPTKEKYCNDLVYNGKEQNLVKSPEPGYRFENYTGKEVGEYKVTAKLKYGYIWKDGTTAHVTINCNIIKPITYTITYNSNGGTTCSSKEVTAGSAYGTLCIPTRSGYTFDGWYTSSSGGTKVTSSTIATGNATIYAHWTEIIQTPTYYTITYNSNGGSSCSSKTVSSGSIYGTLCTPSRTGFNFDGWYTSSSGGTKVTSSTIATGNATIYAHWSRNFTCASTGGTTYYAGKYWYTVSNNGSTCQIVLKDTLKNSTYGTGTYSNASSNIRTAFTTSGSDYNSTIASEYNAGLITSFANQTQNYVNITSSNPYWYGSGNVRVPEYTKYSTSGCMDTLFAGRMTDTKIEWIDFSDTRHFTNSVDGKCMTKGSASTSTVLATNKTGVTGSTVTLTGASKSESSISGYKSIRYMWWGTISGTATSLQLQLQSYNSSTGSISNSFVTNYGFRFAPCGGETHGDVTTYTIRKKNTTTFDYKYYGESDFTVYKFTTGKLFWIAGYSTKTDYTTSYGNTYYTYNNSDTSYCFNTWKYITVSNSTRNIYYVPMLTVRLN